MLLLDDIPPAASSYHHRRSHWNPIPRVPTEASQVLSRQIAGNPIHHRRRRQFKLNFRRDSHGKKPKQEDRNILRGWKSDKRVVHRHKTQRRGFAEVLPGPPEHDGAYPVFDRTNAKRHRAGKRTAAAAARDGEYSARY